MRVRLHDDEPLEEGQTVRLMAAALDGDPVPPSMAAVVSTQLPSVTIWTRQRVGYDDDENPVYGWPKVVDRKPALAWAMRFETNPNSDVRMERGTLEVEYDGAELDEGAVVKLDGENWDVTRVLLAEGVARLELQREVSNSG